MGETCRGFLCLSEPLSPLEEEKAEHMSWLAWTQECALLLLVQCVAHLSCKSDRNWCYSERKYQGSQGSVCKALVFIYGVTVAWLSSDTCPWPLLPSCPLSQNSTSRGSIFPILAKQSFRRDLHNSNRVRGLPFPLAFCFTTTELTLSFPEL